MNTELLKVSLRQRALYLPNVTPVAEATPTTLLLVNQLRGLGYTVSEPLLHALSGLRPTEQAEVVAAVNDVMGVDWNWAALVKGWQVPTGESYIDHFVTLVANALKDEVKIEGTTLPCGHLIPDGTFPLERYNGCPFCGKPFITAPSEVFRGQGTKLKELQLWGDKELDDHLTALLASPVPLDASQQLSLETLLEYRPMPEVEIKMKETRMQVVSHLVRLGHDEEAGRLFSSPQDVMRYLWFRHTRELQIIEPHTLLYIREKNLRYEWLSDEEVAQGVAEEKEALRLKYDRGWCRRVARWLNALSMPIDRQLEAMHPKRRMWVRFIRALRLAEYAKKPGYEQLRTLMDRFYRQDYEVWQGRVNQCRLKQDAGATLSLLKQRPGAFARCLFSTMLWFGPDKVVKAFGEIADQLPARLLLTLGSQAELYFDRTLERVARPLTGTMKDIPAQPMLRLYSDAQLDLMQEQVNDIYLDTMGRKFRRDLSDRKQEASDHQASASIYIDPQLFNIPVAVGDRSATIQDASAALQGTRFPVEGNHVRLFLEWGRGLPAQHLDMDLSCRLLKEDGTTDECAYFSLNVPGAKHSGDIQQIPDQVGTAEYIELDLQELDKAGVAQVVFTCNAYTAGALSPNLVVGWMDAAQPMKVSNETGVAYDPSTVSHFVRISESNLSKGLVFGVLDVKAREITWLEQAFDGQTILNLNLSILNTYLRRLRAKPSIGQLLRLKAEAQGLTEVSEPDKADEAYTYQWALDAAAVSRLLLD